MREDVVYALRVPELLPNLALGDELAGDSAPVPILIRMSGQEHLSRRRAVAQPFGFPRVEEWQPVVETISNEVLDMLESTTESRDLLVEMGEQFSGPLVERAIGEFLGLEADRVAVLIDQGRMVIDPARSANRRRLAAARLYVSVAELIEARVPVSVAGKPLNVIDRLISNGTPTTDISAVVMTMLVSGWTLSVRAILNCLASVDAPNFQMVRFSNNWIDYLLSRRPIVTAVERIASCNARIGSQDIHEGDAVHVRIVSSEPGQGESIGLPFGFGPHHCLGASWTRMICRTALTTVFA